MRYVVCAKPKVYSKDQSLIVTVTSEWLEWTLRSTRVGWSCDSNRRSINFDQHFRLNRSSWLNCCDLTWGHWTLLIDDALISFQTWANISLELSINGSTFDTDKITIGIVNQLEWAWDWDHRSTRISLRFGSSINFGSASDWDKFAIGINIRFGSSINFRWAST